MLILVTVIIRIHILSVIGVARRRDLVCLAYLIVGGSIGVGMGQAGPTLGDVWIRATFLGWRMRSILNDISPFNSLKISILLFSLIAALKLMKRISIGFGCLLDRGHITVRTWIW